MKRAAVLALLIAASTMLTPAAHAATASVTAKCTTGDFSGEFRLSYDKLAGTHRLKRGTGSAGPYIADAGAMRVQVNYRENGSTINAVNRTRSGLKSGETVDIPVEGTQVPSNTRVWVEVRFSDSSGVRCTAREFLI